MKTTIAVLLAIGAFLTGIGGLDVTGVIDLLPKKAAQILTTALPLCAGLAHIINAVVIQLRKAQEQAAQEAADAQYDRFKFRLHPIAFLSALLSSLAALVLSSCTTTTQMDGSRTTRPDKEAIATGLAPLLQLARDLFLPTPPQPQEQPVTPTK